MNIDKGSQASLKIPEVLDDSPCPGFGEDHLHNLSATEREKDVNIVQSQRAVEAYFSGICFF